MHIKSRLEREAEYNEKYGSVSFDMYSRLSDDLGDDLNEDNILNAAKRIQDIHDKVHYNCLQFIFYEIPIQAYRPRTNFKTHGLHVPNAKANFDAIEKFLKKIDNDIKIISTPMKIRLNAYLPMPKNANPVDKIIYETKNDYGIGKPDFDNILKAYCDMIQKHVILDDDLIVSCVFNKYYSLKPRVEFEIIYPDGVITDHTYQTIISRKSYKKIDNVVEVRLVSEPYKKSKKKKKGIKYE